MTLAVVCAVFYSVTASLRALAIGGIGLDLFKRWELHAIAAVAPVSFLLNQNAFQSGRFGSVAVATITIADPAVSIGLGVAWLGESLASGLWWTVGQVLSLIAMAAGVLVAAHQTQLMADWPASHAAQAAVSDPASTRAA